MMVIQWGLKKQFCFSNLIRNLSVFLGYVKTIRKKFEGKNINFENIKQKIKSLSNGVLVFKMLSLFNNYLVFGI